MVSQIAIPCLNCFKDRLDKLSIIKIIRKPPEQSLIG